MKEYNIEELVITDHAAKRLRHRLGIPKRAAKRFAIKVFKEGAIVDQSDKNVIRIQSRNAQLVYGLSRDGKGTIVLVSAINTDADEETIDYMKRRKRGG